MKREAKGVVIEGGGAAVQLSEQMRSLRALAYLATHLHSLRFFCHCATTVPVYFNNNFFRSVSDFKIF